MAAAVGAAGWQFRATRWQPESTSNDQMVEDLVNSGELRSQQCIEAFRAVDRGLFWKSGSAYVDMPLRDGRLHQSAPHIYARALEALLPLSPGMSFLNVGSGTGYFSSLVSELIGAGSINDGVEIWPSTIEFASERCLNAGKGHIEFKMGNIYELDISRGQRYDRIYFGACANARSKYLYDLLEVGGVLVGPFQTGHKQQLRRVVRESETSFLVNVLDDVMFATLVVPSQNLDATHRSAAGLPGVPFTFALRERAWTVDRSKAYPVAFQRVVEAVLSASTADPSRVRLPPDVWRDHILPFCTRHWFQLHPGKAGPLVLSAPHWASLATLAGNTLKLVMPFSGETRSTSKSAESSDGLSTRCSTRTSSSFSEVFDDGQRNLVGTGQDIDDFETQLLLTGELRDVVPAARLDNEAMSLQRRCHRLLLTLLHSGCRCLRACGGRLGRVGQTLEDALGGSI